MGFSLILIWEQNHYLKPLKIVWDEIVQENPIEVVVEIKIEDEFIGIALTLVATIYTEGKILNIYTLVYGTFWVINSDATNYRQMSSPKPFLQKNLFSSPMVTSEKDPFNS